MNTVTNPLDILIGVGSAIGQEYLMGNMILLSFFLIFMIMSLNYSFVEVIIIDSFLTTILAILFFAAGLVAGSIIIVPAVIFIMTLILFLFA